MSELARFVRLPTEPPIVDRTGLTGRYDFTLAYAPRPLAAARPRAPRLPFDVFVVDSFERVPTEN